MSHDKRLRNRPSVLKLKPGLAKIFSNFTELGKVENCRLQGKTGQSQGMVVAEPGQRGT